MDSIIAALKKNTSANRHVLDSVAPAVEELVTVEEHADVFVHGGNMLTCSFMVVTIAPLKSINSE